MSTLEDFENAPVGATATHDDGLRAMKTDNVGWTWVTPNGVYASDKQMAYWGYTLNSVAPTTAREALDIAWELAHEVKEGQVIPKGARYLEVTRTGLREYIAYGDREISHTLAPITRTFEPLPDPKPDWLDAPAVLARTDNDQFLRVWSAHKGDRWASTSHTYTRHWESLRDVTPLYPKEGQES